MVGFRQTGKWRGQLLSEEVNEAHRIGQAAASKLSVRASGQQVRELLEDINAKAAASLFAYSEKESHDLFT